MICGTAVRPGACLVVAAVVGVVGCSGSHHVDVPPPPALRPITTAAAVPDLAGVGVASVPGRATTTAVVVAGGNATMAGQVTGPDGPVAGATVHLERLVGDQVGSVDVLTAADGTWQLPAPPPVPPTLATLPGSPPTAAPPPTQPTTTLRPLGPTGILGGRYRVRAWRTPDLALTAAQVFYLADTEHKTLPLALSRYQGIAVTSDIAPDPPVVGEAANLLVFVTTRSVDENGVVRALGVPNTPVGLFGLGAWTAETTTSETDSAGRVLFRLRCRATGPQTISANVDGQGYGLPAPSCAAAPTTTTSSPVDTDGPTSSSTPTTNVFTSTTR